MSKTKVKEPTQEIILENVRASNSDLAVTEPRPLAAYQTASRVVDVIEKAISNPKLDVKKMQAIMDLQMQFHKHQAEIAYNIAMSDCQAAMPHVEANQYNSHTKSKYANLDAIDTVIRPIYTRFGFSLSYDTETLPNGNKNVICWVRHKEGHKERHQLDGELDTGGFKGTANKTGIQAAGSSTSYLQRYLAKLIFNVVIKGEDKDGNNNKYHKPVDEFDQALSAEQNPNRKPVQKGKGNKAPHDQENPPSSTPAQEEWDGGIHYGKETFYGETPHPDLQWGYLKMTELLQKHKSKDNRLKIINHNLVFAAALVKGNQGARVADFHKLADEGL